MDSAERPGDLPLTEFEKMDATQYLEMAIAERRAKARLWEGNNIFTQVADSKDPSIRQQMKDSYLKEAEALESLDPSSVTKETVLEIGNQFHQQRNALSRAVFGEES